MTQEEQVEALRKYFGIGPITKKLETVTDPEEREALIKEREQQYQDNCSLTHNVLCSIYKDTCIQSIDEDGKVWEDHNEDLEEDEQIEYWHTDYGYPIIQVDDWVVNKQLENF